MSNICANLQVDASVLGDLLGGRVGKAGKCIPEKLLTCALRFKSTWKCIPSAWMSTAQFCDGRSKISGSRVSMGILVAGAVLSHAMRNGEGATHSTTSMINLHPCRQISSAAQPDERQYGLCVQISGNQQELAQKLHKIVGEYLTWPSTFQAQMMCSNHAMEIIVACSQQTFCC